MKPEVKGQGWLGRARKATMLGILSVVTACMRPIQGPLLAIIRLSKRHNMLFLNDWRTDVAPLVLSQKNGENFVVDMADMTIGATVRRTGSFDFEKFEAAIALLPKDFKLKTLYDIGANIGVICIPALKRGLAGRAIAFEPEPKNYQLLVANIYLNGLQDRIEHHNIALGSLDHQRLCFELAETNYGDHRVRVSSSAGSFGEAQRKAIEVPSETLDSITGKIDRETSLVWMDVQGYEGHILAGAQEVVRAGVYLVTEVWPYGLARAGCADLFKKAVAHYRCFYDLSESAPAPTPVDRIEELFERLGDTGGSTDILLC